jgi:thiosulfate/3-mercaptopyruvate sulfurtransferase
MSDRSPALVSTEWLASRLGGADLAIIDASWAWPQEKRDLEQEFRARHIPGAVRFDIDAISDHASGLPHMLPSPADFAAAAGALGIGTDTMVVAYDTAGLMSAARPWWMFRAFGHDKVAVLDGGLPKWLAEARPIATGAAAPERRQFTARLHPELVRDARAVLANVTSGREQLVDARSAGRFAGTEPEPRAGLRGGHVPGSLNLPFTDLLDPQSRTVRPKEAIAHRLREQGVDLARPIVTSCGSGITACVLALGLHLLGREDVAVYDGSWTEWALTPELPVETGKR